MKADKSVDIIMATYNGEKYLSKQIDSILNQTYEDFFLTIYDDKSSDNTLNILYDYENKYPDKIKIYVNKENLGVTKNFFNGVKNTTRDYIMFCDQDDVWLLTKIEDSLMAMKDAEDEDKIPISIFTDAYVVNEELNIINPSFHKYSRLDTNKTDLPHLLMENKLIGCTVMINSEVKKYITKYSKSIRYHDWWIALICGSFGKIRYLNKPTIYYRQHQNNVVGSNGFSGYLLNRVTNIKKQKNVLLLIQKQAEFFYQLYSQQLTKENKQIVYRFANLFKYNFVYKRYLILKYGYLKTGVLRNLGVLLLI